MVVAKIYVLIIVTILAHQIVHIHVETCARTSADKGVVKVVTTLA